MTTGEFKAAFSVRLKSLRKSRKITQKGLGIAIGLSEKTAERTIQNWELREHSPGAEYMRPIAEALDCTLDEVIP